MINTFLALLAAHLVADFVLQTNGMVERKKKPEVLLGHTIIVILCTGAALGGSFGIALVLGFAHIAIDMVKTFLAKPGKASFFIDQLAHIISISVITWVHPEVFSAGIWAPFGDTATAVFLFIAGFALATFAGGPIIGFIMDSFPNDFTSSGLPYAGKAIGILERALIFVMVVIGEPAAVGFLIAAKSILRFDSSKDQKQAEYIIIGTLGSFTWAFLVAFVTVAIFQFLQLGLAPLIPAS